MNLDALIFMPALVGSVVLGFVFLLFVANYYLAVLEGTAAGAREIPWEAEAVTDNFGKLFYLAWLLGIWAGPTYLMARAAAPAEPWLKLAVPLLVMWLLYPVSQLASLGAHSPWVPLTADVFARLAQKPAAVLGFYALTLPVYALFGLALKWAYLTKGDWPLLFVGVPLMALAILMNARLLGRLAFALMFTKNLLTRKRAKKPKAEPRRARAGAEDEDEPPPPMPAQPADLPPVSTPDGELTGYNVLMADDPPAPKKRVVAEVADEAEAPPAPRKKRRRAAEEPPKRARAWDDEDEDRTPYAIGPAEGEPPPAERPAEELAKPKADELALLDRRDAVKPPKTVWSGELLAFLAQPGTLSALLILTVLGTFAGVMVRAARAFDPTAGGE